MWQRTFMYNFSQINCRINRLKPWERGRISHVCFIEAHSQFVFRKISYRRFDKNVIRCDVRGTAKEVHLNTNLDQQCQPFCVCWLIIGCVWLSLRFHIVLCVWTTTNLVQSSTVLVRFQDPIYRDVMTGVYIQYWPATASKEGTFPVGNVLLSDHSQVNIDGKAVIIRIMKQMLNSVSALDSV